MFVDFSTIYCYPGVGRVEGWGRGGGPDFAHLPREARGRNPRETTRVDE